MPRQLLYANLSHYQTEPLAGRTDYIEIEAILVMIRLLLHYSVRTLQHQLDLFEIECLFSMTHFNYDSVNA